MEPIARLFEIEMQFDWHDESETATWHAASWEGAERIALEENSRPRQKVLWYSIEEREFYPCDKNDPDGRLYIGLGRHKFVDLRKEV